MPSSVLDRPATPPADAPLAAPQRPAARVQGLLVALRRPADLTTTLVEAAGRARTEHRPLIVAVVRSPRVWTTDAALVAWQFRRCAQETTSMIRAARAMCAQADVEIAEVITLREPWALTPRGRERALRARLTSLADSRHAELHPVPSAPPERRRAPGRPACVAVSRYRFGRDPSAG
jgi:hypothetical protein